MSAEVHTPAKPSSCTGQAHEHRWLRFGSTGEREEAVILVSGAGLVSVSEQLMEQLLGDGGWVLADPDPVEEAAAKRLAWARSRLQDGLNAALNRRAR